MNIRFYNAKILTMADGFEICEGELWVSGSEVVYVGNAGVQESLLWDREIDVQGNLLMPGFKNAHTHSAMTFLRSYADDMPLFEWLNQQVFPMEAKLTPEHIYHLSKLAIMEYLTSGITANFDMYLTPDTMAQASVDCGFRTVICGAVNDFSQSVAEMEGWYQKYNGIHELISCRLGFHAEYTTSREILEGIAALAEKYQAPVYTHLAETEGEVKQCLERNRMTPVEYLDSLGMFKHGGGGFHCVYMTERDMEILKERGMYAVTNPASNLKLASGIAPIRDMSAKGIPIAIGTDGPASNNCLDMFREMFLVTALAKYREKDASVVDANEVLFMATVGGAKAMGLNDCDTLEPGKKADVILIDLHQPNMQPLNNITKNVVYSGCRQNVKLTMVNGKILYEDGKFSIGTEPEEIYEKANAICNSLKN